MALVTVEGVYENGKVKLAERPVGVDHARVMVTFFPETVLDAGQENPASPLRHSSLSGKRESVAASPVMQKRYSPILREEYKTLILKKMHRTLTATEAARLASVREQINQADRQSESWSAWEHRAEAVEQELADLRQELEALPDA